MVVDGTVHCSSMERVGRGKGTEAGSECSNISSEGCIGVEQLLRVERSVVAAAARLLR